MGWLEEKLHMPTQMRIGELRKPLETLLGEEADFGIMGPSVKDIKRALTKVSQMSPEEVAGLRGEKARAFNQLAEMWKEQKDKKDENEKDAKKKRGKGDAIELTGTLVLYDQRGNRVGFVDDLRRR